MDLIKDLYYNIEDIEFLVNEWLNDKTISHKFCKKNKKEYVNIPLSFDIEVSSFYDKGEKRACMYIWQFGFNGHVVIGRTWDEFDVLIFELKRLFELNDDRKIIIYVHNLSYEFAFLSRRFKWGEVFAVGSRTPLFCISGGVEFRCSYLLSGLSLAKTAEELTKYKIEKLKGDLDYKLVRHSDTELKKDELKYCINDALIVNAFIDEEKEKNGGEIVRIPYTKTGYVRRHCRQKCFPSKDKKQYYKTERLMKYLTVETDEYNMLRRAFQGGFTHASKKHVLDTLENVGSYDLTSAYPAVLCMEQFPMSKGKKVSVRSEEEFYDYLKNYCCIFDITYYNIKCKFMPECYLSESKCWGFNKDETEVDNGRIFRADEITTTITDVDFEIIENVYKYDDFGVSEMWIYEPAFLPKCLIDCILDLYETKTKLKGVKGQEEIYALYKGMLNSVYGCICEALHDKHIFNGNEWEEIKTDVRIALFGDGNERGYNDKLGRWSFYPWAVYTTAYVRRNLWSVILQLGNDYVYSDTDSTKILNPEKNAHVYEEYNTFILDKIKSVCSYYSINEERYSPKTIKGGVKTMGLFDYEGVYDEFKTCGAKRYIYIQNGELHTVVAGLPKKAGAEYLNKFKNPFNEFETGMYISADKTGKLTHTYIDYETKGEIVDYMGKTGEYRELSSIHMEPASFCMSLTTAYLDFIFGIRSEKS